MFDDLLAGVDRRFAADRARTLFTTTAGHSVTYGDAISTSGRFAALFTQIGIKPGDRIMVQAEKSVETLLVYMAALRSGAIYVPINPASTAAEIKYLVDDAAPSLVICQPESEDTIRTILAGVQDCQFITLGRNGDGSLMEAAARMPHHFEDYQPQPDDIAAILYTSGTTGRPKGAMLSRSNLTSNARTLKEAWAFTQNDRLLHALPIFHTHGLFVAFNITLCARSSIILLPKFDLDALIAGLPRSTVLMGVPTFYTRLLAEKRFTRELVAHMRLFVSGSAPLSAEVHREFRERVGHDILERYGMTETNMNTSNPYDGDRVPGSVGLPLPGVEIRISVDGAPVNERGRVGMIEVRGPNVFKGYWRAPEKTKSEFRDDGFFVTGDLGRIDSRGYVSIVGRQKDLIISGGFNVYPAEVEAEIDALPGIAEAAVVGVPHPDLGEAVVAVVRKADRRTEEPDILDALSQKLGRYKLPRKIVFVEELPRNTMGKVLKNELRQTLAGTFKTNTSM
ncbi:malonyl-CoA synthase [Sinorhizobium meliloti]|uniref:malonate--CoA ligase n=1 Tax=Rhizobium meliloti TaxID=382 RepID=UPI003F13534C